MYNINSARLFDESESFSHQANRIRECLDLMRALRSNLPEMDGSSNMISLAESIIQRLDTEQQMISKFSYVMSSAANTVVSGNRRALSICDHEDELREELVSGMLGCSNVTVSPTDLPISLNITL
jgi:archaellum component FlaC